VVTGLAFHLNTGCMVLVRYKLLVAQASVSRRHPELHTIFPEAGLHATLLNKKIRLEKQLHINLHS